MDDDYAHVLAVLYFVKAALLPVIQDIPGIAAVGIQPAEDVHQRGFSGAVFADKGMDAAPANLQIHIIQSFYAGKLLGDVSHFQ